MDKKKNGSILTSIKKGKASVNYKYDSFDDPTSDSDSSFLDYLTNGWKRVGF